MKLFFLFLTLSMPIFSSIDEQKLKCSIHDMRELNANKLRHPWGKQFDESYHQGFDEALKWVDETIDRDLIQH